MGAELELRPRPASAPAGDGRPPAWLAWVGAMLPLVLALVAGAVWVIRASVASGKELSRLETVAATADAAKAKADRLEVRVAGVEWNAYRACVATGDRFCREPKE